MWLGLNNVSDNVCIFNWDTNLQYIEFYTFNGGVNEKLKRLIYVEPNSDRQACKSAAQLIKRKDIPYS